MAMSVSETLMSNTDLAILMSTVRVGGTVSALRERGLEYVQIAALIKQATDDGFLEHSADGVVVSPKGTEWLLQFKRHGGPAGSAAWIAPQRGTTIELDLTNKLYLPKWDWSDR